MMAIMVVDYYDYGRRVYLERDQTTCNPELKTIIQENNNPSKQEKTNPGNKGLHKQQVIIQNKNTSETDFRQTTIQLYVNNND